MIRIENVKTLDGEISNVQIPSTKELVFDAKGRLVLFPGIIDPHFSLGSHNQKKWGFSLQCALKGGISAFIDTPVASLPCGSKIEIENKRKCVDEFFLESGFPLHPYFLGNANLQDFNEMGLIKDLILGCFLMPEHFQLPDQDWDRLFQIAAWEDLPIVINTKNEKTLLEKVVHFAERQNNRLYILNVSNQEEIKLILEARSRSLLVYAGTAPEHLFPNHETQDDFLWEALENGTIETIGSGYQDGVEGEEVFFEERPVKFSNPLFMLPLLLTAAKEGKISFEEIVRLTRKNIHDVFKIQKNQDVTLVDLDLTRRIKRIIGGQSVEIDLIGWPVYSIIQGNLISL